MVKNPMYTGQNGVSYYKFGKRYYSNSGFLEREITREEYEENVNRIKKGNPLKEKNND